MRLTGPRTLRRRIELLLAIALTPALVLSAVNAYLARGTERREAQQEAYGVVLATATTHEQLLRATNALFAASPDPERLEAACTPLAAGIGALDVFAHAGLATMDGRVVCNTDAAAAGTRVTDAAWFKSASARSQLSIGHLEHWPASRAAVVMVGRRGRAAGDEIVWFAALDPERLSRILQQVSLPAGSTVTLIDGAGTIVARHPDHRRWVGRPANTALVADAANRRDAI